MVWSGLAWSGLAVEAWQGRVRYGRVVRGLVGYKSVDIFTNEDVDFVRASILRQLNTMKSKLKTYKEFDKVLFYIDKAIEVV